MSSFGRLRQRIESKRVPHVQHDYFSLFNQSDHCFLASLLLLPSSLLKLPNKMQLSDGNPTRQVVPPSWIKLSVRRIERIGRIDKLARVIVINERQFSDGEHNISDRL